MCICVCQCVYVSVSVCMCVSVCVCVCPCVYVCVSGVECVEPHRSGLSHACDWLAELSLRRGCGDAYPVAERACRWSSKNEISLLLSLLLLLFLLL